MYNEILFFMSLIAAFTAVVMAHRYFGKEGLTAWISVATVLANIVVTKQVTLFGMDATLGNIMFASIYLCTDILSETAGIQESRKAVNIGFFSAVLFIATAKIAVLFKPNALDIIQAPMKALFSMSARTTVASVAFFYLANMADIYMFDKLKAKFPKALWLRNNISTIICNCTENFLFTIAAFYGIMPLRECALVALSTSVIEALVAVCDTPFLYWAKRQK